MNRNTLMALGVVTTVGFAGIGENFQRGGIWLGGDGMVSISEIGGDNELELSIALNQKFYVVDNLSFGLYEGFDRSYDMNMFRFGGSVGYTFLHDGEKSTGPAHTIELASGGFIFENRNFFTLTPSYTFEYFVTERIAPYIKVGPDFLFDSESDTRTDLDFRLGVALHFPTRMSVTIPME